LHGAPAFPKFIATLVLWIVDAVAARIKPRHPTAAANAKLASEFWEITVFGPPLFDGGLRL
jgi:hypothetical protein